MTNELQIKRKEYEINSVPTSSIDENIKVVAIPSFPWICRDNLYKNLTEIIPH